MVLFPGNELHQDFVDCLVDLFPPSRAITLRLTSLFILGIPDVARYDEHGGQVVLITSMTTNVNLLYTTMQDWTRRVMDSMPTTVETGPD